MTSFSLENKGKVASSSLVIRTKRKALKTLEFQGFFLFPALPNKEKNDLICTYFFVRNFVKNQSIESSEKPKMI